MNLDTLFLYNPLNKNEETNLNYRITRKLLSSTQGFDMISPNSFCGFIFTRAIDMDLDPPILQNPWAKMNRNSLMYQPKDVGCQKALIKTY